MAVAGCCVTPTPSRGASPPTQRAHSSVQPSGLLAQTSTPLLSQVVCSSPPFPPGTVPTIGARPQTAGERRVGAALPAEHSAQPVPISTAVGAAVVAST